MMVNHKILWCLSDSHILIKIHFFAILLFPFTGFAQVQSDTSLPQKDLFSLGILGNSQLLALQGELKLYQQFGIRVIGAKILGSDNDGESTYAEIGLVTYYFKSKYSFLEPFIGIGQIYSKYKWKNGRNHGMITDFNVGAGFGTNFRFSKHFRTGLNLFFANGYNDDFDSNYKLVKTSRRLLVFPALSFDFIF